MLRFLRLDPFLIALFAAIIVATLLPARGAAAEALALVTTASIVLLFFLHGAKLSREAILNGIGAWRLHLMTLSMTYIVFPVLTLGLYLLPDGWPDPFILSGFLFLAVLPSTVQSSIAFTGIAGGNVAAAVCAASLSNLLGILITPLLAGLLVNSGPAGADFLLSGVTKVATTLLLPFVAGHLARPLIGGWVDRHRALVGRTDRSAIVLVVYSAFGAAVTDGLWHKVSLLDLALITLLSLLLLGLLLWITRLVARMAKLSHADETVLVFCGSKKSLASGVPMAGALFPAAQVGMIILPLMIFHQIQLIVCAALADAYARRLQPNR